LGWNTSLACEYEYHFIPNSNAYDIEPSNWSSAGIAEYVYFNWQTDPESNDIAGYSSFSDYTGGYPMVDTCSNYVASLPYNDSRFTWCSATLGTGTNSAGFFQVIYYISAYLQNWQLELNENGCGVLSNPDGVPCMTESQ